MALTKITTDTIDLSSDTTALKMPKGTTSERIPLGIPLEYLVVAGGGGASNGGGGAGGLLTNHNGIKLSVNTGTNLTLTVGLGGTGAAQMTAEATQGGDSVFDSITATGGGGGIRSYDGPTTTADGGSGGGGGGYPASRAGSTTASIQGNDGAGGSYGTEYSGGGGGGAGAAGTAGVGTTVGSGGIGATTTIINTTLAGTYNVGEVDSGSLYFAGGGAGGSKNDVASYTPGTGGLGGGADTPASRPSYGQDGTTNTGGGASGATYVGIGTSTQIGGDGGSGVIILKTTGIVSATFSAGCTVNGTSGAQTTNGDTSTGNSIFIITVAGASDTITFPSSSVPTVGLTRENTTTGKMEVYTGTLGWRALLQKDQDVGLVPSDNFTAQVYTGNSGTKSVTGFNFKPDLTWVKSMDAAYNNVLVDSITGAGSSGCFVTNDSYAQGQNMSANGYIASQNSDGFTVQAGSTNATYTNVGGQNYASWCWKAGGTVSTSNNSVGTLTSTASANQDAGFSIIRYTGTANYSDTVGTGLTQAPEIVIQKIINYAQPWYVLYDIDDTGTWDWALLSSTNAFAADIHSFGTQSTTIDNWGWTGYDMINYCWYSVPGYSLINNYTGTGSATDTPIIYTGFEPAWIMIKRTDAAANWVILDNKRSPTNPRNKELYANLTDGDQTFSALSFLSNGFQITNSSNVYNAAGGKYLFMCFAS